MGRDPWVKADKVPGHYGVGTLFYIKNITMESINDSTFCLSSIFGITPIAFQAINEILAVKCTIHHGIVFCGVVQVLMSPDWEIVLQNVQFFVLLHVLDWDFEGMES